jgi:hypothetical protein
MPDPGAGSQPKDGLPLNDRTDPFSAAVSAFLAVVSVRVRSADVIESHLQTSDFSLSSSTGGI